MKTTEQLINNIIGQLNGISKMRQEKKDCLAVLTQMKAAKAAMNNLINKYLEEAAFACLESKQKNISKNNIKKIITELSKNN